MPSLKTIRTRSRRSTRSRSKSKNKTFLSRTKPVVHHRIKSSRKSRKSRTSRSTRKSRKSRIYRTTRSTRKSRKRLTSHGNSTSKPADKSLYLKVVRDAKRKFKVWPSIYASSWVVKEYKKRGGKYIGKKSSQKGLQRWYKEKWIDVCYYPKKIVKCGRSTRKSARKYPYCRPLKRVSKKTPKTVKDLSERELKRRCAKKRRRPSRKVGSR